jgi:hypothetical protein
MLTNYNRASDMKALKWLLCGVVILLICSFTIISYAATLFLDPFFLLGKVIPRNGMMRSKDNSPHK